MNKDKIILMNQNYIWIPKIINLKLMYFVSYLIEKNDEEDDIFGSDDPDYDPDYDRVDYDSLD